MTRSPIRSNAPPGAIDCETAVRRLWDFLDGRLSASARDEVEAHLAVCAYCPPHFSFAEEMRRALATSGVPELADDEQAHLRARVRGVLARLGTSA